MMGGHITEVVVGAAVGGVSSLVATIGASKLLLGVSMLASPISLSLSLPAFPSS